MVQKSANKNGRGWDHRSQKEEKHFKKEGVILASSAMETSSKRNSEKCSLDLARSKFKGLLIK